MKNTNLGISLSLTLAIGVGVGGVTEVASIGVGGESLKLYKVFSQYFSIISTCF